MCLVFSWLFAISVSFHVCCFCGGAIVGVLCLSLQQTVLLAVGLVYHCVIVSGEGGVAGGYPRLISVRGMVD